MSLLINALNKAVWVPVHNSLTVYDVTTVTNRHDSAGMCRRVRGLEVAAFLSLSEHSGEGFNVFHSSINVVLYCLGYACRENVYYFWNSFSWLWTTRVKSKVLCKKRTRSSKVLLSILFIIDCMSFKFKYYLKAS